MLAGIAFMNAITLARQFGDQLLAVMHADINPAVTARTDKDHLRFARGWQAKVK